MDEQLNDLIFSASHNIKLLFDPSLWEAQREAAITMSDGWELTDFPPVSGSSIPDQPAVYAFVVEPGLYNLTPANGLFYVGCTNSLRRRVGEYKSELNNKYKNAERPHVWRMIHQWNGYLKIYYRLEESKERAISVEQSIIAAFSPHFNRKFPEGKAGDLRRAFP